MYIFTSIIRNHVSIVGFNDNIEEFFNKYIADRDCEVKARDSFSITIYNKSAGALATIYTVRAKVLRNIDSLHIPISGDAEIYLS